MPAQGAAAPPRAAGPFGGAGTGEGNRMDRTDGVPTTAVVFAGGDPVPTRWAAHLPAGALVIAADSGLRNAAAFGRPPDLVVGDLDSADPADVEDAVASGAEVERHPEAKDRTDLELALLVALDRGARHAIVVGGGGGRVDHFLAGGLLLASPDLAGLEIEAFVGDARLAVVRTHRGFAGEPGSLLSLLAVGGPARGVRTRGLRFPLHGETLAPGSTRGVSNEMEDHRAEVSLDAGVILAVQPDGGSRA